MIFPERLYVYKDKFGWRVNEMPTNIPLEEQYWLADYAERRLGRASWTPGLLSLLVMFTLGWTAFFVGFKIGTTSSSFEAGLKAGSEGIAVEAKKIAALTDSYYERERVWEACDSEVPAYAPGLKNTRRFSKLAKYSRGKNEKDNKFSNDAGT